MSLDHQRMKSFLPYSGLHMPSTLGNFEAADQFNILKGLLNKIALMTKMLSVTFCHF
jgi:hypothetical protein